MVSIEEDIDDIIRCFQVLEIRYEHHLVIMCHLSPFVKHGVGTQIARYDKNRVVSTQIQPIEILTEFITDIINEECIIQIL